MYGMVKVIDQELKKWARDPGVYALTRDDLAVVDEVREALSKLRAMSRESEDEQGRPVGKRERR